MSTEEEYKKELADAGVDLPKEAPEESKEETPEKPKEEPKEEPKESDEEPEEPKEPLQDPKEPRKRSIYDEYKDKKAELKSERELREQAEAERDELKTKLEAVSTAETPQEKREAQDELEAFAKEIGADPDAIRKMRSLFLKDFQSGLSEEDKQAIADLREFKKQNESVIEKQKFDEEFKATAPTLKEMFPNASDEEMEAIKDKLDEVSHTMKYHDKDLDYVAYKEKEILSALISPKKKGMERKGNTDISEESFDFDPNADYAKLSPAQKEKWEAEYKKLTASQEGLSDDGSGGKVLL